MRTEHTAGEYSFFSLVRFIHSIYWELCDGQYDAINNATREKKKMASL